MDKLIMIIMVFGLMVIPFANIAFAHCPLCSAATASAVTITRLYGVDDLIVGSLIGAFTLSTALWMNNYLMKRTRRKGYFAYQKAILVIAIFGSTLASFIFFGISSPEYYKLFGIDKLIIGVIAGGLATQLGFVFHDFLRKMNSNKNHIPAQSIFIAFLFLLVLNSGFYIAGFI